jgi:hypothetical protein
MASNQASTQFRFLAGVLGGAALLASAVQTAEAKRARIDPALYRRPLVLTSFVQNKRTDVRRNEVLEFKFSAIVNRRSVDARSLRVLELTTSGKRQAVGALSTRANVVRFDPTRSQRNYDDSRRPDSGVTEGDNATGFTSFTDFLVEIPGPPELHTLKNARGEGIRAAFTGQFGTNTSYYDPVPGQPYFIGHNQSGNLGFDPPRSGATGLVDEDAVILLEFSEPMNIDTLDPSSTVSVIRTRVNEAVPGFIRVDPNERSGRKFQFVPSLGFGSDLANQAGWDIKVVLTEDILDLAGNKLKRPYDAPPFRTRYVPGKRSASIISESFVNQTKMDAVTLTEGGEWNTIEKGALRGGAATAYPSQDVMLFYNPPAGTTPAFTRQYHPLVTDTTQSGCPAAFAQGSRAQILYIPTDVGAEGAIVSVGWGPSSNALFGAQHPEITIQLGHTSLSALGSDMDANVNIGSLLQVFRGPYSIPQAKNIQPADGTDASGVTRDPPTGRPTGFWLYPILTTPFEYNGTNNLVVDIACQAANNCQLQRGAFFAFGSPFPARRAISQNYTGNQSDLGGTPDQVVYDARFNKRRRTTKATSTWYELASDTPQFADPIVSPVGQPGGVTVTVEMEAAHGRPDPLNPGRFIPNTSTATGWTTDITQIDGHRFFRFRVTMVANLTSNQTARLTAVQFPYQF